jgi:predicted ester cyclase
VIYSERERQNMETVRHLTMLVNSERYEEMDELFHGGYIDHNPGFKVTSLDDLKQLLKQAHRDFGIENVVQDMLASDDFVAVRVITKGQHLCEVYGKKPDGKALALDMIEIYRLSDAKIAERWVASDVAGLMKQMGVKLPF